MTGTTSFLEAEIASQPRAWLTAAEHAGGAEALPGPGERVAVVGCGSSWFVAQSYAALREGSGQGLTDAFVASEAAEPIRGRAYDRVLAITRSGTTTEVIDLLRAIGPGTRRSVVTAVPGSPVLGVVEDAVALPFADERSVVQTRFMTSALALLRAHLGEDLHPVAADGERALGLPLDTARGAGQITFLGQGWTIGLAHEAALKTREAARFWAESYPAMDYRHGPISIAEPGRVVWCLGPEPVGLRAEVEATGADWIAHGLDPLAELVVVHRLALALATDRGYDPDRPRHLTRSVMLEA